MDGLRNGEETKSPLRLAGWGLKSVISEIISHPLTVFYGKLNPNKIMYIYACLEYMQDLKGHDLHKEKWD
jgi:hypothetical protein